MKFTIQIVDENGNMAHSWFPGSPVEKEFINAIMEEMNKSNVGIFTRQETVKNVLFRAITTVLFELKNRVKPE